jgi:hypothetical protein
LPLVFKNRDFTWEVAVPHAKKKTKTFAGERKILEEWIPLAPSRPVYTAIRTAFIERFAEYYKLLTETVSNSGRKEPPVSPQKLADLDKECMKLAGLLFSRSNVWAARDWRKPSIVKFLLRDLARTRGGRPATKLTFAMQAKEMKLSDPKKWTWPKITAALCDCGKAHDIRCQDNLRREVLHLERTMRKLGCTVAMGKTP